MKKQLLLLWLCGMLLVLTAAMLSSCVHQTELRLAPFRIEVVDTLASKTAQAITGCDSAGIPTVYILRENEGSIELYQHELTHVRQMARSGLSCMDYLRFYVSHPEFRLQNEAEAYCNALKVHSALTGEPWASLTDNVVRYLSENYQLTMSREHIRIVVVKMCTQVFLPP